MRKIDPETIDWTSCDRFVKTATVLAFQVGPATYDKTRDWNTLQHFTGAHMLLVGPIENNVELPGARKIDVSDVYGCALQEFQESYTPTGRDDEYRKITPVRAVQMNEAFTIDTVTQDENAETTDARGEAEDWLVRQATGEVHLVKDERFRKLYRPYDPSETTRTRETPGAPGTPTLRIERYMLKPLGKARYTLIAPQGAQIFSFYAAEGRPSCTALVDDNRPTTTRTLECYRDGNELLTKPGRHLGSTTLTAIGETPIDLHFFEESGEWTWPLSTADLPRKPSQ